jgi:hypothetical protein
MGKKRDYSIFNKNHKFFGFRYKINFFDNHSLLKVPHNDKCYQLHGKVPRTIKFVEDGSGLLDLFHFTALDNPELGNADLKIAWLAEPRNLNLKMQSFYHNIENNYEKYFENYDAIFTHDHKLLELDSRFKFLLGNGFQIKRPKIFKKSKLVSMISSNKTGNLGYETRLEWVEKLKDNVDLFGQGFKYIKLKEEGLCDYMFSVAIENSIHDTWITEKVLDCFATGTIPVYLGTDKIKKYFNEDGIIFLDDDFDINSLNEELYYSKIDAIKDNFYRVMQIEHPLDFMLDEYLPDSDWLLKN